MIALCGEKRLKNSWGVLGGNAATIVGIAQMNAIIAFAGGNNYMSLQNALKAMNEGIDD
jgi:hypothetical protein